MACTMSHSKSEAELRLVPGTLVSVQHSLLVPLQVAYKDRKHFWKDTQEMNSHGYPWAGGDWEDGGQSGRETLFSPENFQTM